MARPARTVLLALLPLALACGADDRPDADAGGLDAGDVDSGGGCGPNPCGACRMGCETVDRCVDGSWVCDCDCSGLDAGADAGESGDGGGDADGGGTDAGGPTDAGPADAGGSADAGPADAGGSADAGPADAGGSTDAGAADGGLCAGVTCSGAFSECCPLTGACYDTRCLSCCMGPVPP